MSTDGTQALERCLQELYLPAIRAQYATVARQAARFFDVPTALLLALTSGLLLRAR